ncbi:MAG: hypothetical protein IH851_11365 [Armatimonadetes bacterium]|nr:hypothetical protein [Armatimonadota bacterium]
MAQHTSNDLPVRVGAVVVGLIAVGVFYFMKHDAVKPLTPAEPTKEILNPLPVATVMIDTSGSTGGQQMRGTTVGGRGAQGSGRETPSIAGN